jgi:hypothetical protein
MNAQHTPGPWKAISPHPGQWAICKESHQKHLESWTVAYVRDFQKQDEANAQLIAAAPELLEALRDAEFLLRKAGQLAGPMQDSYNRSAADARAAIAKATA